MGQAGPAKRAERSHAMHPACHFPVQKAGRHRWRFPVPNARNTWRPMKQTASPFQGASGAVPVRLPVVIPHFNRPGLLDRGLRSLNRDARRPDEITLLETGAPIRPEAICGASPDVLLFRNGSQDQALHGPRAGRKIQVVPACMDADCPPDHDWGQRAPRMGHRIRYLTAMKACHPAPDIFQDVEDEDRGPARRADPGHGP